MITSNLSRHEINLITKILDQHQVHYVVDASGVPKTQNRRGDASFYQIDIQDDQFQALPESAKMNLANLGIYPELEEPDFSEEKIGPEKKAVDVEKSKKTMKNFERIFIAVMVIMFLVFLRKVLNEQ